MDGEAVSFPGNHTNASKNELKKKRKRKFSLLLNGSSETPQTFKKKKLVNIETSKQDGSKFVKYKNTSDYLRIVAKSSSLPPPPQIFKTNQFQIKKPDISECFLLNFLSGKSLCTERSERFKQVNVNGLDDVDCKKRNENKKKNDVKKVKDVENIRDKKIIKKQSESARKETVVAEESEKRGEENVESVSHVEIYNVVQRKALIFHMSHPSQFSFHGEIKATIIAGEVEILGYTLSQSSTRKSVNIYSPNLCTPLIVESKVTNKQPQPKNEVQAKLKDLLTEEDCSTLLSKFQPKDSLLLVEQIISDLGIVLNKYFDKVLFPKDMEDVSSMSETLMSLQSIFSFKLSKEGKHFTKNEQWDRIPLGQCTVLCGGKGVGKSTLLRYFINKLLAVGEKVLVVDLDPGQPEFTYPGCISAVIADEPVIGPNFTHISDPVIMTCFGDVNVSNNPTKYLECVNYIVKSCKQKEELLKMKWLVNTMGFCKGLGVELITTTLKLLRPNTVIQIRSSDFRNNYPFFLTPTTLNARTGFRSMPVEDVELSHDLRVVSSSAERENKQFQGGLRRKKLRDIMSLAYFSKMVSPPFYNLNAVQPYLIPFSKLYLGVDFLLDPSNVLKAFNGNVVSLSHFEPDDEEILSVASGDYFQVVVKPRVSSSLGIGFVRGIDCREKRFYVLTHLPLNVLERVNCLSLRRVGPPHCMFLRQEEVKCQTVYTTTCSGASIRSVKRMFRVPGTPLTREKTVH